MNVIPLGVSPLTQSTTSLLDPGTGEAGSTLASVLAPPPLDLSAIDMRTKLAEGQHNLKAQLAQQRLDQQQAALGKQLLAGLAKQGLQLSQDVSFSIGADGALSVTGTTADVDKVQSFFKRDTSQPSLHDQLSDVLQGTQAVSATAQTSNAISMAARYAGSATNVMALYNQFMSYKDDTSAKLTLSAHGSSLSYAGMFSSQA